MKNENSIVFLILTFVMILYFGCKPKEKEITYASDYRRIPLGEAKDYLYALPGSYWIYKNTVSGVLDTQVCTAFLLDTLTSRGNFNDTKHITIEYERILRIIYSKYNKVTYYDETNGYSADSPSEFKALAFRKTTNGTIYGFFFPCDSNENSAGSGVVANYLWGGDTLTIQGNKYNDVGQFSFTLDGIDEKDCFASVLETNYYWARNAGLIKKTIKNCNYSWELIDYNIIK